ncbi:Phospholipase A2 OS=Tsukamurella paurometabola (strain ATCC 8368 / DSM / CCUG 35730 / CIP 100753/ JCM 10117 / KCTC 9821 / NBRC 16120 / NCIMB 702349 / NCTC 13040) OX=521096 GN=Tpau_2874 PE=4 SV=1 [Tsukamurella paurometabola]|uniref:Phospholipase A2 n=1 Tax=Tsukamurella paurometabola (strain ATCC 8368 / DSM 20162 / CCUG 35730 / CIP 100753 / JCM 10117 / KCTC 9821 / NBRC 16120 / NCIMB 702349 / NCTC 13040) TaxID=521096 RepID=D5UTI7_TSUPD|nr:hypothetical protein [Tsukamurella paurometabola]ADG79472.1 conserved hypothetical protein [Tsukamurella paurometabola DSM 20162]SUP35892.1 Prokaryotic phospholipase A2 [Tsukamurella paurometabola]
MNRRTLVAAAAIVLPVAVAIPATAAPAPSATVSSARAAAPAEDRAAAAAVRAVTDPDLSAAAQVGAVPADLGYRATAGDGYAVNPSGDCSSMVRLPDYFAGPCQAHDLGYDLLRYADSAGRPLGSWARQRIDDALADRLRATCTHRPTSEQRECRQVAVMAVLAVRANTWRQHDGPPRAESAGELAVSWLTAGGRL